MSWIREPNAEPIPGYRLLEPLGSGGFGEVWKCEAPGGIHKAIKFVYGNLNSLDVDCVRAEQELRALNRIKEVRHPFVCSLDRIEIVEGELVIVMELAERTLHDVCQECINAGLIGIPRDQLLRYLADAAEALDHMNEKHTLQHLDVKPRNLFLISDRVKVADFGLVKHLERQSASGLLGGVTPLYAAPETFVGKISQQTDQYSLAIVFMELLTGNRPFAGKNVRQLAQQHLQEDPDLRSLPEPDRPIIGRALSKDPGRRFPNCMAMVSALYKARPHARSVEKHSKAEILVGAPAQSRPETFRDFQLDEYESNPEDDVDLGAPPNPDDVDLVSDMGVTVPQPETGALRPTLILGVGAFGRKALLELRCRFIDRFGDLSKLGLLRFLYIDPDPESAQNAGRGAPDVALTRNEYYPLPLQAVGKYRQRNLDQLADWLPREKLYAMPRSLQTQGSRALGRLAFADNLQRLLARLRREIQEITNPDVIYQTVTQTGLALRDHTPRVYVLGAAGGGCSGLLPDLGYAVRRLLTQLRHPDARVNLFLLGGAPGDPATPKTELANIYATLTEINHFSDPSIPFAAQYGSDGQRIVDQGKPYHAAYFLTQAHRSPDSLDETVAHLGNFLFHELTTPLGMRLDNLRMEAELPTDSGYAQGVLEAPLRSLGTYAVWFPRGLLLRLAARHACRRLIEDWLIPSEQPLDNESWGKIESFLSRITIDPDLQPESLAHKLESTAQAGTATDAGTTPGEVLAGMLAKLEEQLLQPVAQEDPGNWAKQALTRIRDWVGSGEGEQEVNEWRKTRLTRALGASGQRLAEEWDRRLSQDLLHLMEHPGPRIAVAESALERLRQFCQEMGQAENEKIAQHAQRTAQSWAKVEHALHEVLTGGGGFRLFGGRSRTRQLRAFMDQLAAFARHRLAEEVLAATRHFFGLLAGRLAERGRDLGFCRQRLRHLQENLDAPPSESDEELMDTRPGSDQTMSRSPIPSADAFWEAIRQSNTARVVLPDQETDLERAALRFLQALPSDLWEQLDKELHERVLLPRGGLHGACTNSGDLIRQLAVPLLEETGNFLGHHLPIMDVAQILGEEMNQAKKAAANDDPYAGMREQMKEYLDRAVPLLVGKLDKNHHAFLLVPASPAGKTLAESVQTVFPDVKLVRVAGQADLMVCREQGSLTAADLQKLLKQSRAAYENLSATPITSPHARFDITDWLPLNP